MALQNPAIAEKSAKEIFALFENYRKQDDFVGMDMARKFIQMGYTRARRYANYPGGRKYEQDRSIKTRNIDEEKAASAAVFKEYWDRLRDDADYLQRKKAHQIKYG